MAKITVEKFSCIAMAEIELRQITVLIGPQASGKSVLAKLFYFFSNLIQKQYVNAEDGDNLRHFKRSIAKDFAEWFPPSAWGKEEFSLTYEAGEFCCTISRKSNARGVFDEVEVVFSDFFDEQYNQLTKMYRLALKAKKNDDEFSSNSLEKTWRVRSENHKALRQRLGEDLIGYQVFVPAGRSFYTNLGKAFAMLEYGSQIDEVTKRFGRLFTDLLDGESHYWYGKPTSKVREFLKYQSETLASVFGGKIKLGRNDRHVLTGDGRKIPFSILSSGQQELLPLVLIIEHFTRINLGERSQATNLLYIEEPEAHLFPSAQGALAEHLTAVAKFTAPMGRMFVTTHSPYVLACLNNLIKSHQVSSISEEKANMVERLIPSSCWLPQNSVNAYALEDGTLRSIIDNDGLIDADYLDSVSSKIAGDFMELLGIEACND